MGLCPVCLLAATGDSANEPRKEAAFPIPTVAEVQEKFPHLEVQDLIGRGGMGAVYRVRQPDLDRIAALKILPPSIGEDPAFADRFAREAKALAKLNHANIVTLYEFGAADGLYFFLMEFVDGVNLRQAMNAGRFTPDQALAIVPPVCEALQYAHDQGVVHRDIKPENLLLDKGGQLKIADFGIAKMITGPEASTTTEPRTGHEGNDDASLPMGTPSYMAPEQLDAEAQIDHRVDVYATGVVLYELLTGEKPKSGEFENPSQRVRVDVRIDEVVLRALESNPEQRYASARDFRTRIEAVATEPPNDPPMATAPSLSDQFAGKVAYSSLATAAMILIAISFNLSVSSWDWRMGNWIADFGRFSPPDSHILFLWPIGKLAPIAATIVAWLAVVRIRQSDFHTEGLLISVIIALIYPLACLNEAVSTLAVEALREATNGSAGGTGWFLGSVSIFNLLLDGLAVWIIWRIARRPEKVPPTTQNWSATAGLAAAAFSGLMGIFSFLLGTNSDSTLEALIPASAIVGMSLGVLTWPTLIGKIAAATGTFNLLLATLFSVLTLGNASPLNVSTPGNSSVSDNEFGRTVTVPLPTTNDLGQIYFLDLDDGSLSAVAGISKLYSEPMKTWLDLSGGDLTATTIQTPFASKPTPVLIGDAGGTQLVSDDRRNFGAIRPEHFDERISRAMNRTLLGGIAEGYAPHWFRTSGGNTGVVQITELETVPPMITLRYKLIGSAPVYHTAPGGYDPRWMIYTAVCFVLLIVWSRIRSNIWLPRFRMEQNADNILAANPNAESKTVRIVFTSLLADGKQREIDEQIALMAAKGWTFVRIREDNLLRAFKTRTGSAQMDFIRTPTPRHSD